MGMMEKLDELASEAREYLTFRLDEEEYGIDIMKVQEIRGYEPPTRVANAPDFIKGVVNLRGTIVPIVDMRLKFNCSKAEYNAFTVVIILNLRSRIVGVVAVAQLAQVRQHRQVGLELTRHRGGVRRPTGRHCR